MSVWLHINHTISLELLGHFFAWMITLEFIQHNVRYEYFSSQKNHVYIEVIFLFGHIHDNINFQLGAEMSRLATLVNTELLLVLMVAHACDYYCS